MSIEYKCKKCPKQYSTYKSLWRHNALKHKIELENNVVIIKDQRKNNDKNVVINDDINDRQFI